MRIAARLLKPRFCRSCALPSHGEVPHARSSPSSPSPCRSVPTFTTWSGTDDIYDYGYRTRLALRATAARPISETLTLHFGATYLQKGAALNTRQSVIDRYDVSADGTVDAGYLQLPVLLSTEVMPPVRLVAGPALSFALKCGVGIDLSYNDPELTLFDGFASSDCSGRFELNSVDLSLLAGAGVEFPLYGNASRWRSISSMT